MENQVRTLAVQVQEQAPRVDDGEHTNHDDEADENQVVDGRGAVSEQVAQFGAVLRGIACAASQIDREDDDHAQQEEERHGLEQRVDDHHHFVSQRRADDAEHLHGQEHREAGNGHPLVDVGVGQGHDSMGLNALWLVHRVGASTLNARTMPTAATAIMLKMNGFSKIG